MPKALDPKVIEELIRLRDEMQERNPLPPYYPRGTIRFVKVVRPEESGNVLAGTLFPFPMSQKDAVEAEKLCKEYGISLQDHQKWTPPSSCGCGCHHPH